MAFGTKNHPEQPLGRGLSIFDNSAPTSDLREDSEYEDELEYEYDWGTIARKEKRANEDQTSSKSLSRTRTIVFALQSYL